MPKFRKKPSIIEAVQYPCEHPALATCDCKELNERTHNPNLRVSCSCCGRHFIRTLEGNICVRDGDWILTDIQGRVYPRKPDIFEAMYEPIDE